MRNSIVLILLLLLAPNALADVTVRSPHAATALEIYRHIVELDTSKTRDNTLPVAQYLADKLIAGGMPKEDAEVITHSRFATLAAPKGEFASLVARLGGDGSLHKPPILLLV